MTTKLASQNPPVKQAEYMALATSPQAAGHLPSVDVLLRRYGQLKTKFQGRNRTYLHLLRIYDNDPVAHGMQGGGDQMEMIVNRWFDTVNTFVDFMGIPPNIHFFPPDLTPQGAEYADSMEKYLYASWDVNEMDLLWPKITFDQALLGTAFAGVLPLKEFAEDGFVQYRRFTPVNFYPQMYAGTNKIKYYFYESKYKREEVLEEFGADALKGAGGSVAWKMVWPEGALDSDEIIVLEYCDEEWLLIMVMDKVVRSIRHNFSFCPSVTFPNIVKPDITGGVSSVATYESMQIYESELYSIVGDILSYWGEPMLFIQSETLDAEKVNPGGITVGGKDDKAYFVTPKLQTGVIGDHMKRTKEVFHDGTIPETLYGRLDVKGALGSAPALSGLQTKFMVRLNGLYRRNGRNLAQLNTMALRIGKKLYGKKKISHAGWRKNKHFLLDMNGSQIQEFTAHRVFWDGSVIDPDRHVIMQMQLAGNKLQSNYTTMENLGMSAVDETERLRQQDIYEIKRESALKWEGERLMAKHQAAQPVDQVQRDNLAATKGGKVYPTASGEQRPGPGRPRGAGGGEPRAGASARGGLDPERVAADLRAIKKLKGEVYLVDVAETIDVAITDQRDKSTILNAPTMQVYKGRVVFVAIKPGQAQEGWQRLR